MCVIGAGWRGCAFTVLVGWLLAGSVPSSEAKDDRPVAGNKKEITSLDGKTKVVATEKNGDLRATKDGKALWTFGAGARGKINATGPFHGMVFNGARVCSFQGEVLYVLVDGKVAWTQELTVEDGAECKVFAEGATVIAQVGDIYSVYDATTGKPIRKEKRK